MVRPRVIHLLRPGSSQLFIANRYHFGGDDKEGKTHRDRYQSSWYEDNRREREDEKLWCARLVTVQLRVMGVGGKVSETVDKR